MGTALVGKSVPLAGKSCSLPGIHPGGVVKNFARTSEARKSGPGMAKAAKAALSLDVTASWVVGDRPEDIRLAEAIGASAVYVEADGCQRLGLWSFPALAAPATFTWSVLPYESCL